LNPSGYFIMEFFGTGDPFFGGHADDRPVGEDMRPHINNHLCKPKVFPTKEQAIAAFDQVQGRRSGSLLGVVSYYED